MSFHPHPAYLDAGSAAIGDSAATVVYLGALAVQDKIGRFLELVARKIRISVANRCRPECVYGWVSSNINVIFYNGKYILIIKWYAQ